MHRFLVVITIVFCSLQLFAADTTPAKPWTTSFGAGVAVTSGNTDTKNFNLSYATKYDPKTKFVFKADVLYLRGSANGTKQVDKGTADVRGEYALSDRTFAFGEVNYLRDPFKGLSYFVAPLAGGGYRIIKSDTRNLTVDGAAGAEMENTSGIGRSTSGALKAGEDFDWALSPSSKITEKLSGIWKTKDFGDALYHVDAGITTSVATRVEVKFSYVYDYKTRPSPGAKKGDSALFAALLFKF
jgi:putative salt-induced outer membrane protein YdiY